MFETIAHLLGEGFELLRRASNPDAVRRRLIRQKARAYRRFTYYEERNGARALRKALMWKLRYRRLDSQLARMRTP